MKKSLTQFLSSNSVSFYGDYYKTIRYAKLVTSPFPAPELRLEVFILQ